MFRTIIFTLAVLLLPCHASSQTAREQKIIQTISRVTAAKKSFKANFVQTKTMAMFGDKLVAKGRMLYKKPDYLQWEYITPYAFSFVLDKDKVVMTKDAKKNVIDIKQNAMFKEIARLMLGSVVGKCLTDKREFRVSIREDRTMYVATLIPQKKPLSQMYTKIILHFDRKTCMVSKVVMQEDNGDETEILIKTVI